MTVIEGIGLVADIVVIVFALGWGVTKLKEAGKRFSEGIKQGMRH